MHPSENPATPKAAKKAKVAKKVKATFSGMKSISIEEAEDKLKKIQEDRPEQYEIACSCADSLNKDKNCSIRAEEKTGKRVIMEAIHLIMLVNHGCNVRPEISPPRSVYVTALNRKDTKVQFKEQEEYGIFSIVATKHASLVAGIIEKLNDDTNDGIIYIHLDECDYGSGSDQSLSKLYSAAELNLPNHKDRIKYVTYSATPEELEYSDTIQMGWDQHVFIPSKSYLGAQWYLDNNLVFKTESFFDGGSDFSDQGQRLIKEVILNCSSEMGECVRRRNVIVVRDTGKGNLDKIRERKSTLEEKYGCEIHIFDQRTEFGWGDPASWAELGRKANLNDNMEVTCYVYAPVLIFISQICTRSTEICPLGHRKIAVWHDARKLEDKKAYNTISQAIGRIKHYSQEGHPVNRIKLYCDKDVLKMTVGKKLNTKKLVLGQRIKTTSIKETVTKFVGYKDDFGDDPSTVPDPEWQMGDPNGHSGRPTFINIDGKWCLYDGKVRYWGELKVGRRVAGEVGGAGLQGVQAQIQYENENSDRYMVRGAVFKTTKVDTSDLTSSFEHKTKKASMW
jgi:hypothetical protein